MRRLAWGLTLLSVSLSLACGGRTDQDDAGAADAAVDHHPKPLLDSSMPDAGYQPLGTKCDPPTGAAPSAWTPGDAGGAALRPPLAVSLGGPTLKNPVFVPITFDGDDLRDPIEDFVSSVGCTSYWKATAPDFGINDAYAGAPVHLPDTPPATIDDSQIGLMLRQKIVTKAIPAPVAGQTLYVIFYPDSTDITLQGDHSCQSFGGYHSEVGMTDGSTVPYAVLPRCNGGFGVFDQLTAATSHELMEAVTDPFPMTNPAYLWTESNGLAWAITGGGEVADLCESNIDSFYQPADYPFTVQRIWSNHSAFLAQDPCQPSEQTYFAAAPVLPDTIAYDIGFGAQTTTGVKLAVNASTTIDLKLIADSGSWTSPITVTVHDASKYVGGSTALTFSLSPQQGNVGDTLKLGITRIGTTAQLGVEPFVITAESQGVRRSWWAVVGDP